MSDPAGFRGIGSLIEHLRRAGFRTVGTSEAVDAMRLLLALAEKEPEILSSDRLRTRLRPIFSKNREQQETFDRVFARWARASGDEAAAAGAGEGSAGTSEPEPQQKQNKLRNWRSWAAISLVLVSAAIILIAVQPPPPQPAPTGTDTTATTTATTATTETSGAGTDKLKAGTVTRQKPKADIVGYFPRIRYNHELRPRWGWIVAALPLVPLVLFGLPAVVITRSRSRRRSDTLFLDRNKLEEDARKIVPPLRQDIAVKLSRHLRTTPEYDARLTRRPVLDVRATIEGTLRNRGIPSPRFRSTHAPPTYLLLIDVANQKDPRGRLFYQWAERLHQKRIDVEFALVRLENGEPQYAPVARGELAADRWLPLSRLPSPPHGQRLILISTGELLVDDHDAWRSEAVAARLHRWRERVMFTPLEPRDWSRREDEIERAEHTADPGFVVMPLDENALAAWTDLLTTGQVSQVVLSEPQRFPGELRRGRGEDLLSDDTTPDPKRVERLIAQLRTYLGDLGFSWLAALAIPPFVRWELTTHIGRDVIQRLAQQLGSQDVDDAIARIYRRLVRLPWLRMERMPNWLRLRLLADLSPRIQNEVRKVVENLLGTMKPTSLTDGVLLEFGAPPRTLRGPMSDQADPVYLGYMNGLTPRQLAMRAPRKWRPWLRNMHLPRERGLCGLLASAKDRATSWWARLVFLGGVPASGLRAVPMVFVALLAAAGVLFLSLVERKELTWWPPAMRSMLFEEREHAIAFHHRGPVLGAEFNGDGTRVVTAGADGVARVWDVRTGAAVSPPLRHQGAVRATHFSHDGSLLVTASGTSVRLWDTRTWKQREEPIENGSPVESVELDPGLRKLIITGNGAVRVYSDRVLSSAVPLLNFATFSNDGRMLALFTDRTVALTRVSGVSRELEILDRPGDRGVFDRAGRHVAVSSGRQLHLYDSDSGKRLVSFAHPMSVRHAELSPDGTQILTSCDDGIVRLWDTGRPDAPRRAARLGDVVVATFSPEGDRILAASANGVARVWDVETGRPVGPVLRHQRGISSAVFSSDGGRIVTAGADGIARVWQAFADKPELPPMHHEREINAVSFDPEGRRVLTASTDGTARIWDANNSTEIVRLRHRAGVRTAKWSRDGRRVFTISENNTCFVWDSATGRVITSQPATFKAAMSPDGRKLAISDESSIRIVDAQSGATLQTIDDLGTIVDFAPNNRYLLVHRFLDVEVWDSVTGRPVGPPLPVSLLAETQFSPDSRSILIGNLTGAQILDVATGTVRTQTPRILLLQNAIFDPAGARIGTDSWNGVQLWDARTGALIRDLTAVAAVRSDLSFSPDGRLLATELPSGGIVVWDTDTDEPVSLPFHHRSTRSIAAFSPDGTRLVTAAAPAFSPTVSGQTLPLLNEHRAPASSAQIWRLPPRETPRNSSGDTVRHALDAALDRYRIGRSAIVAAAVLVAVLLVLWPIAMWRRMKEIERVAAPPAHEAAA